MAGGGIGDSSIVPHDEATDSSALAAIDKRLSHASSAEEILLWTHVRREVQQQNDFVKNQEHRRSLEAAEAQSIRIRSLLAMVIGFSLIIAGNPAGYVILSIGLYNLAPKFIEGIFSSRKKDP